MKRQRIQLIDAARGFAVILMVFHHAFYDAVVLLGAPLWIYTNPVFDYLQPFFAGLFIFLAGVSSRFSRSNIKRGALCTLAACAVTVATYFVGEIVRFGVLHLLAVCMMGYAALELLGIAKRGDAPPKIKVFSVIQPFLWIALIIASAVAVRTLDVQFTLSWVFGWTPPGFTSSDYFPLLPWAFVFALGAWAGRFVRERRLPERFYTFDVPFFPSVGRKSLAIYMLHQPILYGATWLVAKYL